jgi:hypothetical protein
VDGFLAERSLDQVDGGADRLVIQMAAYGQGIYQLRSRPVGAPPLMLY